VESQAWRIERMISGGGRAGQEPGLLHWFLHRRMHRRRHVEEGEGARGRAGRGCRMRSDQGKRESRKALGAEKRRPPGYRRLENGIERKRLALWDGASPAMESRRSNLAGTP